MVNRSIIVAALLVSSGSEVLAQAATDNNISQYQEVELEEIQVLGSYIKGTNTAAANPVSIVSSADIEFTGATEIADIMNTLSVNSGAENRPDTFTSFYSQGTSNVNLRGLGLSSTLVLLNGKRQTISGAKAQDGSTFVDTSSVPAIALERLEILKEGAAAAYGSDAVAGVVNFITKDEFDGVKIDGSWQSTDQDSQTDTNVSIIGGFGNDTTNIVLAASALRRNSLNGRERPDLVDAAISSLGTSFVLSEDAVVASGDYAGSYRQGDNVGNPKCDGEIQGVSIPRSNGNRCGFHYGLHYNIVNEEEREQYYGSLKHVFESDMELKIKAFYTDYRIIDNYTVPSYPILTFPTISASHPNNPFGVDVTYLGRINPTLDPAQSPAAPRDNTTFRLEGDLRGGFSNGWDWITSATYSENEYTIRQPELSINRLNAGFEGRGGVSGNEFLNPFDPTANSLELLNTLKTEFGSSTTTSLFTLDMVTTGSLSDSINMAAGAQFRRESYDVDPNLESTIAPDPVTGINNRADFIFLGGVNAVDESRSATALFAEMEWLASDQLTVNAALRYEDLDTDSSVNPKIAALFEISDQWLLRASASTSFREPSLSQFYADTVSTLNVQDYEVSAAGNLVLDAGGNPIPKGGSLFIRRATTGNLNLEPEEATNYNLGLVFEGDRLQSRIDYWKVDYEDVISIEDAQGKLLANPNGPDIERLDPNDPNSELGGISTDYFNAETIDASGIDFESKYTMDLTSGSIQFGLGLSHYLEYVIPINGQKEDVAGEFNRGNFARSLPETKGNVSAHWLNDSHSVYARMSYTSSYDNGDDKIDAFTPVEVQYRYLFDFYESEASVSLGIINAFDEEPPFVRDGANFSYDPKHHDPRGRLIYIRGSYKF